MATVRGRHAAAPRAARVDRGRHRCERSSRAVASVSSPAPATTTSTRWPRPTRVVGVGIGVDPADYPSLDPLLAALGAELGATRKVTDNGWLPRARQIGITGRSVAPRLFVSIGASGKFNHSIGVRAATHGAVHQLERPTP